MYDNMCIPVPFLHNIPAVTDAFLRVACRSRNFSRYSRDPQKVTCKNCQKTQVFKSAMKRIMETSSGR